MNIQKFAEKVERGQIERLKEKNLGCEANILNARTKIITGRKYTKVNVGGSGKYMIDKDGNIFGIKAYGQVNKAHHFGNLETVDSYYWGNYSAYKIVVQS